jgi:Fe-S-cluster-containing hydrogenase component 2
MNPIQGKMIVVDPDKCTGCHGCEMACSIKHFDLCSPYYSRIRIHEFRDVNTFIPLICQACDDAPCIGSCPKDARIRVASGAVVTEQSKCIGCNTCIFACPFGAPVIDPETGKTMTCDRCDDDELGPWCVKACTMQGALTYVRDIDASKARGRSWAETFKKKLEPPGRDDEGSGFQFSFGGKE